MQETDHTIDQQGLDFWYVGTEATQQVAVTETFHSLDPRVQAMAKKPLPDFNQDAGRKSCVHEARYETDNDIGERQHDKRCRDDRNHAIIAALDHGVDKSLADQRGR